MKVLALTTVMLLVACAAYGVVETTDRIPRHDFRILVTRGVVVPKTITLEGQTTTVPAVEIVSALNAQGQTLEGYKNRTLRVTGPLVDRVLSLQGHEVVVRGIVRKDGTFQVTWIQDKQEASENIHAPTPVW